MTQRSAREIAFETEIVDYLSAHGWLHNPSNEGWDIDKALFVPDVLHWLSTQFPEEYDKVVPSDLDGVPQKVAESMLLQRLDDLLNKTPKLTEKTKKLSGGLLGVLRDGFSHMKRGSTNASFENMVEFFPESPLLPEITEIARSNRLRVLRQVRFDSSDKDTIDLVLTVNGIPVVTIELKTDNTQAVRDAIKQYRVDRKPKPSRTLLKPGRCLVHFAVSNQEVYMTTELKGSNTFFLPFNKGTEDGYGGNPPNADGSDTSYLWEDIFEPELFLRILRDYALWEPANKGHKGRLIFPRYHQLRATEKVIDDVSNHGVGGRYLIQHSAGSGKTKTIAWLAHRLGKLMNHKGKTVFDSIIVVTDRTALDDNIKEGLGLLQASEGVIINIDRELGTKSKKLDEALDSRGHIISCTIQTFPALAQRIEKKAELRGKTFCVIVDEAHSSQHGEAGRKLRETLVNIGLDEDQDYSSDDILLATDEAIVRSENLTFVALTATPKAKTLAVYGTYNETQDKFVAFDTYEMSQAIDEGFILDVLSNYSTYAMFGRIRDELGRKNQVNMGKAVNTLVKYARLHPTAIAQKVQVVVEHFRRNVMHELDGTAKAMVVTADRRSAFHWSQAMNKYISKMGYSDMTTLVAFSGSLEVTIGADEATVTEASLNQVSDTAQHFRDNDDCKVLIVASKYQTGFDEPRLTAMYVDKKLSGVTAVQTLSRLNRTAKGKPKPMVVDFVNEPDKIVASFAPYYRQAHIDDDIPFNALQDLAQQLDDAEFYTFQELEKLADAYVAGESHSKLQSKVSPIRHRWNTHMKAAYLNDDKRSIEVGKTFRANLVKYVNAWEFLSQIVDYHDASLRKRAIVAGLLARNLNLERQDDEDDYTTGIDIVGVQVRAQTKNKDLGLHKNTHDGELPLPGFDGRPVAVSSPVMDAFDHAVEVVNQIIDDIGLEAMPELRRAAIRATYSKLISDSRIQALAKNNDADQVAASATFRSEGLQAIMSSQQESDGIFNAISSEPSNFEAVLKAIAGIVVAAEHDDALKKKLNDQELAGSDWTHAHPGIEVHLEPSRKKGAKNSPKGKGKNH